MNFSVTERQSFKRCRRSWYWGSFNGVAITPIVPSAALDAGRVWHLGHERWVKEPDKHLDLHMVEAFNDTREEIVAAMDASTRDFDLDTVRDTWEERRELLEAMAMNYETKWGTSLPYWLEFIQPEQTVLVPVPGCEHSLEATLDGLARHKESGLVYIIEHKTYNARPTEESLKRGDQYLAYLWVIKQLGYQAGGVAYDGAWKRPSPPRGKVFDDLFLRDTLTRNEAEIEEFGMFLPAELNDMAAAAQPEAAHLRYHNHPWNGCYDCSFKNLCENTSRGHDDLVRSLLLTDYMPRPNEGRKDIWPGNETV